MANSFYTLLIVTTPEFTKIKDLEAVMLDYPGSQMFDFYTMDMEELSLIAKHRILPATTILVFDRTKVVARIVQEVPSKSELKKLLKSITQ